ncbi:MAG: hypothetical protein AB7N71_10495 [Phycisphaerae bacterium]
MQVVAVWMGALALCVVGCAPTGGRFPQLTPALAWPSAPDTPRIRYLGTITGPESLGIRAGGNLLKAIVSGPDAPARLITPMAVAARGPLVAVADAGAPNGPTVYLFDRAARTMQRIERVSDRPLREPLGLAFVNEQTVVVADAGRGELLLCDVAGRERRVMSTSCKRPVAVAWDAAKGTLWVADAAQHEVVGLNLAGTIVGRVGSAAELSFPVSVAVAPSSARARLAIADAMNFRVARANDAFLVSSIGAKGDGAGDFSLPRSVAFDSAGHLYVLDNQFENVQLFDEAGQLLMAFGEGGAHPGQFNLPAGLFIDDNDWIWIADSRNQRIQVFEFLKRAGENS